ncbi:unnamed protein product [Sympodiomycopsis kandeliae]
MLRSQGGRAITRYLTVGARSFATSIPWQRTRDGQRLVLGIETSCDDSCAALVSSPDGYTASSLLSRGSSSAPPPEVQAPSVVSSVIIRQDHGKTAGIHPLIAQTYHMQALPEAIKQCLDQGGVSPDGREIDAVAFTQGPGMPGCLSVGLVAAKTLAATWDKPLIPVHHMEAHALTPFLMENNSSSQEAALKFPFLTFLLSGGHTLLVLAKGLGDYEILANGECEAIGASFDNAARYFSLTTDWTRRSPGAALESFASDAPDECPKDLKPFLKPFKIPLKGVPKLAYSGLTSGIYQQMKEINDKNNTSQEVKDLPLNWQKYIASQYQKAAFEQIIDKIKIVLKGSQYLNQEKYLQSLSSDSSPSDGQISHQSKSRMKSKPFPEAWKPFQEEISACNHLIVSGGVASNSVLRSMLAEIWNPSQGKHLIFPPVKYCVDNAVMIANVGSLLFDRFVDPQTGKRLQEPYKKAMQTVPRGKWSMEELVHDY